VSFGLEPDPPKPIPKVAPKSAVVKATERWQKSDAALIRDATLHNEALVDHVAEAKARDLRLAFRQAEIDRCWQSMLDAQAALRGWGGCHVGPGDPDW
jgi:hypothetical protein